MDPKQNMDSVVEQILSLARKGEIISMYDKINSMNDEVLIKTAKIEVKKILKSRGFNHQLYEAREKAKKQDWVNAETSMSYARRIANFCQSDTMLLTARLVGFKLAIIYDRGNYKR